MGPWFLDTKCSLLCCRQPKSWLPRAFALNRIWFVSTRTEETDGSVRIPFHRNCKSAVEFSMVLDEGGFILHDPIGGADHDFAIVSR